MTRQRYRWETITQKQWTLHGKKVTPTEIYDEYGFNPSGIGFHTVAYIGGKYVAHHLKTTGPTRTETPEARAAGRGAYFQILIDRATSGSNMLIPIAKVKAILHESRFNQVIEGQPIWDCLVPNRSSNLSATEKILNPIIGKCIPHAQVERLLRHTHQSTYKDLLDFLQGEADAVDYAAHDRKLRKLQKANPGQEVAVSDAAHVQLSVEDVLLKRTFRRVHELYRKVHHAVKKESDNLRGKAKTLPELMDDPDWAEKNHNAVKKAVMKANASDWAAYDPDLQTIRNMAADPDCPFPRLYESGAKRFKEIKYIANQADGGYGRALYDISPLTHHDSVHESVRALFLKPLVTAE